MGLDKIRIRQVQGRKGTSDSISFAGGGYDGRGDVNGCGGDAHGDGGDCGGRGGENW